MDGIELITTIGQMSPLMMIAAFSFVMFVRRDKQYNELNHIYRETLRAMIDDLPPEATHVNGDLS